MYGDYSVGRVDGFCHAVAVGNPIFDRWFEHDRRPAEVTGRSERGLYLPTYGSLSTIEQIAPHLADLDREIVVKLHHAEDPASARLLPDNCVVLDAGSDPLALFEAADFVISDMSGAAYDAVYAGRPVVLVGGSDPRGADHHRLSEGDVERHLLGPLAAHWSPDRPLDEAVEDAQRRLVSDDARDRFVSKLYVNPGKAGEHCAAAIVDLVENGRPENFGYDQVRHRIAELTVRSHDLATRNERLDRANKRLRSRAEQRAARAGDTLWRRMRPAIANAPRLETAAVRARRSIDTLRQRRRNSQTTGSSASSTDSAAVRARDPYSVVPAERREQVAAVLDRAFDDVGLVHAWDRSGSRPVCAVLDDAKPKLIQALMVVDPGLEVRSFVDSVSESTNLASDVSLRHVFGAQTLRVGSPFAHRHYRVGDDGCVDIAFVAVDTLRQRILGLDPDATKIDWTAQLGGSTELGEMELTAGPAQASLHLVGDVDLVYTWVDSSDPSWQRAHAEFSPNFDEGAPSSANIAERFIDRDELRYSLRAVWAYAPFVRHIYIVTADQFPDWLGELDDRVTIVPHSEIFPDATMLPTFNSHAIEACLHRIPGLSEFFVYMNDDVFFGHEISPETFFTRAGQLKVRFDRTQFVYDGAPRTGAIPTDWAAYNANALIARDFGLRLTRKSQHVGHPLRRSLLDEIEQRYPDEVDATRRARFRSSGDLALPSMFVPYYAIASGQGVESPLGEHGYVYADTGRKDFAARTAEIVRREPTFFCLNATLHEDIDLDAQAHNVAQFLEARFPFRSPFEK